MLRRWCDATWWLVSALAVLGHLIAAGSYSGDISAPNWRYLRQLLAEHQTLPPPQQQQQAQPSEPLQYYQRHNVNRASIPRRQNDAEILVQPDAELPRTSPMKKATGGLFDDDSLLPVVSDSDDLFMDVRQRKSNNLRNMMRIGKRVGNHLTLARRAAYAAAAADIGEIVPLTQTKRFERTLARVLMYPHDVTMFRAPAR